MESVEVNVTLINEVRYINLSDRTPLKFARPYDGWNVNDLEERLVHMHDENRIEITRRPFLTLEKKM